jgi:hypothetical protein
MSRFRSATRTSPNAFTTFGSSAGSTFIGIGAIGAGVATIGSGVVGAGIAGAGVVTIGSGAGIGAGVVVGGIGSGIGAGAGIGAGLVPSGAIDTASIGADTIGFGSASGVSPAGPFTISGSAGRVIDSVPALEPFPLLVAGVVEPGPVSGAPA